MEGHEGQQNGNTAGESSLMSHDTPWTIEHVTSERSIKTRASVGNIEHIRNAPTPLPPSTSNVMTWGPSRQGAEYVPEEETVSSQLVGGGGVLQVELSHRHPAIRNLHNINHIRSTLPIRRYKGRVQQDLVGKKLVTFTGYHPCYLELQYNAIQHNLTPKIGFFGTNRPLRCISSAGGGPSSSRL